MRFLPHAVLLLSVAAAIGAAAQAASRQATQPALAAQPSLLEAHLAAAHAAQVHQDCHTAAQEYHAAARLMPSSGELRTNEAIALYCDRQFAAARTTFTTALQLNRALPVPHLFLGFIAFSVGDLPRASKELNIYLASKPEDPTARLWLGYTLAAQGDPAAARLQYKLALSQDPRNLDAEYALGEAALALAHRNAVEMQTLDPSQAHVLELAGVRYQMVGDTKRAEAAEAEAKRRLQTAPAQSADAARRLASLNDEALDEQKEALDAFAAILEQAPDSYRAHEVRGDALVEAEQQPEAIAQYEEVIRLNPTLPGVHETLSLCLMTAGRFADALTALEAELALSPAAGSRLQTRIGQTRLAMGDNAGAAQALELATRDPGVPAQAYLLLGQVRLRQNRPADSVAALKQYIAADPNNSTAFYYLSRAYRALGDKPAMAQALADYGRTSQDARARALVDPVTRGSTADSFAEVSPAKDLAPNSNEPDATGPQVSDTSPK